MYEGEDIGSPPNPNIAGLVHPLQGDGDFSSPECIAFLQEADIVVTNPPFSLFREYVALLIEYGKHFVIVGNTNAVTYKNCFELIRENKMWLGYNCLRWFYTPEGTLYEAARSYWYTNLDIQKRHEELTLYKKYSPEEYPHYDNYDAISVDKTADIPCDYDGAMGVPITYLDKHNPDQFEIIGATESEGKGFSAGLWDASSKVSQPVVNGERKYKRIFIRKRK